MDMHSETHRNMYDSWTSAPKRVPCHAWAKPGFGIDRHNDHVSTITGDGLRWSTETATLIACIDGTEYGVYLFRTAGGRYFNVRLNYPMRYDNTDPLEIMSIDAATRLYADIAAKDWGGKVDPFDASFPSLALADA